MYLFYLRMYGYNQIRGREEITLTFKQKVFVFEHNIHKALTLIMRKKRLIRVCMNENIIMQNIPSWFATPVLSEDMEILKCI